MSRPNTDVVDWEGEAETERRAAASPDSGHILPVRTCTRCPLSVLITSLHTSALLYNPAFSPFASFPSPVHPTHSPRRPLPRPALRTCYWRARLLPATRVCTFCHRLSNPPHRSFPTRPSQTWSILRLSCDRTTPCNFSGPTHQSHKSSEPYPRHP